jgi:hypothetical protein
LNPLNINSNNEQNFNIENQNNLHYLKEDFNKLNQKVIHQN